jgi:pimeloyl-ACP methyl ester carboxylesterase
VDKQIIFQSSPIHYRVEGQGFPVMLIHGFGEDARIWDGQVEFLKANDQLIVPNLPGSGDSPYNEALHTVEDYAQSIKAILDAEGIKAFKLIGHSMGGYIALAFAEQWPDYLKAFGLFHSTAFPDSEEKKQARKKSIEFIREHGSREFIASATPNLFSDYTKKHHSEMVTAMINRYVGFDPLALINYYEAMIMRPDRTAVLKTMAVPVLFIIGESDKAVPMEDTLKQSHLPLIAQIHIFKNNGHMGMLENSDQSNECLKNFLGLNLGI